jgi:DNA-binding MarR family transcriptional regulator
MNFDRHCTSAARLSILASLVPTEGLTFMELRSLTGLADGNLHVQAGKLAEAGYIESWKQQRGQRTITHYRITEKGLAALRRHAHRLQSILEAGASHYRPSRRRMESGDESQVW